ncbi:hypothetical protein Micr_00409 [Candidatus Micrarchaeum sp.]|jgi:hypothetical protein|uniref:hypothetical protein n=1 Tax=Candidatus Micrarchaeum sp. TaxID=2282148 RepID=UPI00092AFC6F|nr:hypothetical protein [Candidatus Micrarchaeum sp.]OJI07475.1 MAG: hypothetical protein BK997_02550 [Candidatus Micrarchaeum sp. ARMAN-1]OJT94173.1 MAG: hypothetical protein JJ59_04355 [Candidatus Micrarchaeum sp. AZ1]OWP53360.1 MAG: hypothetical protein B2I19_02770 [Thermoplasmatales archaeon ARMAN]QRF73883.1 hypothetical protein Micr_00409 [Candidatus Micrarchaeum sp.]
MQSNYAMDKIMHKQHRLKMTEESTRAIMKFQRIMYAVMAINIAVAVFAVLMLMLLSGVVK